jgi:uncharacterized membrane protein
MTIFEMILRSTLVFLSVLVPGYLVSLALFKRTGKFSSLEMLLLGIPFGMFLPSILGIIEFDLGIPYSPTLALANVLLITIVAGIYVVVNKIEIFPWKETESQLKHAKSSSPEHHSEASDSLVYSVLLILVLFFAWWLRIQTLTH